MKLRFMKADFPAWGRIIQQRLGTLIIAYQ
jgi:hypothetical protein